MQNFIGLYWTINALLTVRSEMLPFSGNNQNIKYVRSPPEHFAIGYSMYIMIICHHWAMLHYNMSFQTIAVQVWRGFLMISCTFWRSRKNLSNSPKLSCGFKPMDWNKQKISMYCPCVRSLLDHNHCMPWITHYFLLILVHRLKIIQRFEIYKPPCKFRPASSI